MRFFRTRWGQHNADSYVGNILKGITCLLAVSVVRQYLKPNDGDVESTSFVCGDHTGFVVGKDGISRPRFEGHFVHSDTTIRDFLIMTNHGPEYLDCRKSPTTNVLFELVLSGAELEVIRLFIAQFKDPKPYLNFSDKHHQNRTPLMLAATLGNKALVELLLDSGADPDLQDIEGKRALDMCHDDEIRALIRDNSDPFLNCRETIL